MEIPPDATGQMVELAIPQHVQTLKECVQSLIPLLGSFTHLKIADGHEANSISIEDSGEVLVLEYRADTNTAILHVLTPFRDGDHIRGTRSENYIVNGCSSVFNTSHIALSDGRFLLDPFCRLVSDEEIIGLRERLDAFIPRRSPSGSWL